MKVTVLGLGMWGFCLARHLALNGHNVTGWTKEEHLLDVLRRGEDHPHLKRSCQRIPLHLVSSIEEAIQGAELLVESVTTGGLREVLLTLHSLDPTLSIPLVLTSKGIEQKTHLIPPDVFCDVFGASCKNNVAMLSGPSFAAEVARNLPAAVVCGGVDAAICDNVINAFSSKVFRVYPNNDVRGVAYGGALKNVIAISCGVAEGLGLGTGAMAALVTRGLHEMVKLAVAESCQAQTLYGLSGLGDLYLTCSSPMSRNFRFGQLMSSGLSRKEAETTIGMVVEGAYTCEAAKELALLHGIQMPITEAVFGILSGHISAAEAVARLMQRHVKEEHL
jgi:glycerol-3-phosphate dehydrogenase (NAD(P)+)